MNELTIDGKIYISSKRAAEVTGYAKDYIGQLCREGHVEARMVGRSWYVLESSIRAHRFGGDPHATPVEVANNEQESLVTPTDTWERPTYIPEMAPSMPIPTIARPVEPSMDQIEEPGVVSVADTAETLTDMQAAWKEWFAQKQDTLIESPEILDAREEEHEQIEEIKAREDEIAQNIQAFKDAHQDIEASHHEEAAIEPEPEEEAVSITPMYHESIVPAHQYEEIEEESEPVAIHHAPEAAYIPPVARIVEDQHVPTKRERKQAQVRARKARMAQKSGASSLMLRAVLVAIILLSLAVTAIGTGYASHYMTGTTAITPVLNFLDGTSTYTQ